MKLETAHVRQILCKMLDSELRSELSHRSDLELSNTDLYHELNLDSMDFEEMLAEVDYQFDISVDCGDLKSSLFMEKPTVRNFIKVCNDCGY